MKWWEIEQEGLKDGRCKGCKYCRGLSANDWSFYGCTYPPYKGKWVAEIKDCPKKGEIKMIDILEATE